MDWWTIVLVIGGLFVAGFVIQYVGGLRAILGVRLQRGGARLAVPEEIAPGFEELYRPEAEGLAQLGFASPTWVLDRSNAVGQLDVTPALVLRNEATGVIASLSLHDALDPNRPVIVELATYLTGGRIVRTFNWFAHAIIDGFVPEELVGDARGSNLSQHIAGHADAVARAAGTIERLSIEEHIARTDAIAAARHVQLDRSDDVKPEGGHLVPTFRLAHRWLRRYQAGETQRKAATKNAGPRGADIPAAIAALSYARTEEMLGRRPKRVTWMWILLGTGVAFAASMIGVFDATTALVLVPVVLFHELGHLVAMRLSGYRNVSIFFIPFFGGAAIGQRVRPTLAKEMFVLLAGPVPGILLAVPVAFAAKATGISFLTELATWLALVNLGNLLPIYPLDGGRIAHDIAAGRSPIVPIGARVMAIGFFALSFFLFDDTISLVLAIAIGLAFPTELRLIRFESELRRKGVEAPDAERVLEGLREHMATLAPGQKRVLLKRLLDRLAAPLPSIGGRFAAAGIYAAVFVVGCGAGVAALALNAPAFATGVHSTDDLVAVECGRDLSTQLGEGEAPWLTTIEASFADGETFELVQGDVFAHADGSGLLCAPWDSRRTGAARRVEMSARRTYLAIELRASQWLVDREALDDGTMYLPSRLAGADELARERPVWLDERTVEAYRRSFDPGTEADVRALHARLGSHASCQTTADDEHGLVYEQASEGSSVYLALSDAGPATDHAERAFRYLCAAGATRVRALRSVGDEAAGVAESLYLIGADPTEL